MKIALLMVKVLLQLKVYEAFALVRDHLLVVEDSLLVETLV